MPVTDMLFAIAAVLIFAPLIRILYYILFYYWAPMGILNIIAPFYRLDFFYNRSQGVFAIRRPKSERCLSLELPFDEIVYGDAALLPAFFAGVRAIQQIEAKKQQGENGEK